MEQTRSPSLGTPTPPTGAGQLNGEKEKIMDSKWNPLYWYVKALDGFDEWLRRTEYQGRHWAYRAG